MANSDIYREMLDSIDQTPGLTRFDFLQELYKDTIKSERAQTGGLAILCGLGIRPLKFEKAGSIIEGHAHNFDHATFIVNGSVLVCTAPVPDQVEINGELRTVEMNWGKEIQFIAPAIVPIDKNIWHRFVALEPSYGFCVFPSRDGKTGEPVSVHQGFMGAYN